VTGLDIDRLVLTSASASVSTLPAPSVPAPPAVRITKKSRTSFDLQADRADAPFWLVLGQSHNLGWHAFADGRDLGPPVLIDGFANGWRLEPGSTGTTKISLRWVPQRTVWLGLAVSALAAILCLLILVFSALQSAKRRRGAAWRGQDQLEVPELGPPRRPHPAMAAAVAVGFGLAAGPAVGVAAGAVTLLAGLLRPARWLALGSAACLAAAGAYVAMQQYRYRFPPDFAWPVNTERAHSLGWLAVALLVATAGTRESRKG
jgi:hypothetical protein